jgi:hypothetical protein
MVALVTLIFKLKIDMRGSPLLPRLSCFVNGKRHVNIPLFYIFHYIAAVTFISSLSPSSPLNRFWIYFCTLVEVIWKRILTYPRCFTFNSVHSRSFTRAFAEPLEGCAELFSDALTHSASWTDKNCVQPSKWFTENVIIFYPCTPHQT